MIGENLLRPAPTLLPDDYYDVVALLATCDSLADVATAHPESPLAWAALAEQAFTDGKTIEAYAFARTGYHRGLDALRKNGWKGQGPVPWQHEPNRAVLRALYQLRRAAHAIGEAAEVDRLTDFLNDADPSAIAHIEAGE